MTPRPIALGTVFEIESCPNPLRVIALDHAEVMYDVWWPHRQAWSMATLRGNITYFRLHRAYFEAHARLIRVEPLSEMEERVHRPDLPFALARREDLSWYDPWRPGMALGTTPVLEIGSIHLAPFGPRDSAKSSSLLKADNGKSFSEQELLLKAKALQDPYIGDVRLTEGVGLYRSGIRARIPSYYLWGAKSRAEASTTVLAHAARLA